MDASERDPIDAFAARLIEARRSGRRIPRAQAEAAGSDLTIGGAYGVQASVCRALGPARAFKTGRKALDLPVIVAPVLESGLRGDGAVFSARELGGCGIELEIGFRLDRPLPPVEAEDFAERARGCVTPLPVIEIIDGRIEAFTELSDALKLADNQMNGGLVWAEPQADGATPDFVQPVTDLRFDGRQIVSGPCPVPGGDAFDIFVAFARAIGDHCGGFQPGQIVTTGSLTGMLFVEPGTRIEGRIEGLGTISVSYE
ncbi:hypothetical protein U0C82_06955 [Fulvimarina sp. 2208YS6-2-32]|uniref:2-keto-4-pentenoate hydratase n=1 Tax=Fulvimarina uroteuthidis TaxID=3098149 RepID=A0ABU5I174_9HYPH|nr:hypothetical protein [Fulvimarina sp. 2208YS6-2-32]MDY8108882.1 hypothetical protein [Fulvimarina sp. 2208YS6-2-32]